MKPDLEAWHGKGWLDPVGVKLPSGSGKSGPGFAAAHSVASHPGDVVVLTASRNEITNRDTRRLIHALRPDQPADDLTRRRGRVLILTEGYDDDPREIYEIPEVRWFWRAVSTRSPTLLFFAAEAYPTAAMALWLCVAERLLLTRISGSDQLRACLEGANLQKRFNIEMDVFLAMGRVIGLPDYRTLTYMADSVDVVLQTRC